MTHTLCEGTIQTSDVMRAAREACDAIAPNWPLDRSIAVSPYWNLRDRSFAEAAEELALLAGSPMTMPLSYYREKWLAQEITREDLAAAATEMDGTLTSSMTPEDLVSALDASHPPARRLPLLSDVLDSHRRPEHQLLWAEHITTQVSQCCASFFDEFQADWAHDTRHSLYAYWLETVSTDIGAVLSLGDGAWRRRAATLPPTAGELLEHAVRKLALAPHQILPWFRTALYRMSGWASWCSFLAWEAGLYGNTAQPHALDLLAVRIAWEVILFDGALAHGSPWAEWQLAWEKALQGYPAADQQVPLAWLRAHEIAYQRSLLQALAATPAPQNATPDVQAAFCIDVRSEPLRRNLERIAPWCSTLGFAGFFGLPIAYQPMGSNVRTPHLPGLLTPQYTVTETSGDASFDALELHDRRAAHARALAAATLQRQPGSAFNYVEAAGPLKLFRLWKDAFQLDDSALRLRPAGRSTPAPQDAFRVTLEAPLVEKAQLCARVLRAMGLDQGMAKTVLFVGHGASCNNNPMAAALECGACGGQSGWVNARTLANLLNDRWLRLELKNSGIDIPEDTIFLAALHDTTRQTVTLDVADRTRLAPDLLARIESSFALAAEEALRECAEASPEAMPPSAAARSRAQDWAELRPELALAGNAALIIGPRAHTRGITLDRRVFLHDYDPQRDSEGQLLEQIVAGPVAVAHWINLQYFASCVDPLRYGSGDKTLHNVVGGHLGFFEGNGGDLRIGLARQSLHDGTRWLHEPLRLTVVVYAPLAVVTRVMEKSPMLRDLTAGRWLYLFAVQPGEAPVPVLPSPSGGSL